jgi:hypothetical protein
MRAEALVTDPAMAAELSLEFVAVHARDHVHDHRAQGVPELAGGAPGPRDHEADAAEACAADEKVYG